MGAFPSGQRGQTVNLLSTTSVVRIHPLPPKNGDPVRGCRFFLCSGGWIRMAQATISCFCEAIHLEPALGGAPVARRNRRGFSAEKRIHPLPVPNPQRRWWAPRSDENMCRWHMFRGGPAAVPPGGHSDRGSVGRTARYGGFLVGAGNARPQPAAALPDVPPGTLPPLLAARGPSGPGRPGGGPVPFFRGGIRTYVLVRTLYHSKTLMSRQK